MRISLVLSLLAACGGAGSPPAPAPAPAAPGAPLLLGRPVATAPLDDAEQQVFARASASLAAQTPALDGERETWQPALRTWLESRITTLQELNRTLERLPRDARGGLFASIVVGVAMDDFVADLLALPLPSSLAAGPYRKDAEAAYRDALEEHALPVVTTAKQRLERCAELAPSAAPPLRAWAEHCRSRAGALAALETRVAARPKPAPRPARPVVMKDCAGGEKVEPEPDALPPDRKVKPKLVVVYEPDKLRGADRERLIEAVTKRVRAHAKLPLLSRKDIAAGEALVAQRRMRARGPVCGQAPRLTQVLGAKHRHVIVARATTECLYFEDDRQECGLRVAFDRAGAREHDGLPATLYAPVADSDVPPETWIAAASALAPNDPHSGILGMLRGGIGGPHVFSLKNYGDDDPWLRVGSTLYDDAAAKIAACVDAEASFDVTLAISPTGATTDVALTPITAPPNGSRVAECVRDALKATAFPCTRDGKAAMIDVRMCVAPKP